jgi:hypothetical protein
MSAPPLDRLREIGEALMELGFEWVQWERHVRGRVHWVRHHLPRLLRPRHQVPGIPVLDAA